MLADQLTKSMLSVSFMRYCTTGFWNTTIKDAKVRIRRALRRPSRYSEQELERNDFPLSDGNIGEELELDEFLHSLDDLITSTCAEPLSYSG